MSHARDGSFRLTCISNTVLWAYLYCAQDCACTLSFLEHDYDGRAIAKRYFTHKDARKVGRRPNVSCMFLPKKHRQRSYLKIKARSAEDAGCDFEETRV